MIYAETVEHLHEAMHFNFGVLVFLNWVNTVALIIYIGFTNGRRK